MKLSKGMKIFLVVLFATAIVVSLPGCKKKQAVKPQSTMEDACYRDRSVTYCKVTLEIKRDVKQATEAPSDGN